MAAAASGSVAAGPMGVSSSADIFSPGGGRILITPSSVPPGVDMSLHAENRARLAAQLKKMGAPAGSIAILQGGKPVERFDTDHEDLFRQESNFHWAFGVAEPDFYGAIEVDTGRSILFCPNLPDDYAWWMGPIKKPADWQAIYAVDEVRYDTEMAEVLGSKGAGVTLLRLHGFNTDGKKHTVPAAFKGVEAFTCNDTDLLWNAIASLRVYKTGKEQALLRYIAAVSSEAHIAVMQHARPGQPEYKLESTFWHWCYYHGGARFMSYTCICASGDKGAILHYGHAGEPNRKTIKSGDMCLFDMGAEYHGYGSDITVSFPASGTFSPDQKMVYNAVLGALKAVLEAMKPGVSWVDMHTLAYRVILTHLRDGGLLVGDVEEMMKPEYNLGATFMPHGLGHFLGIDTHDVGGYLGGVERPTAAGYKSLRTARALEAGMYITVEPGCYFIDSLINAALGDKEGKAKFINAAAMERFRGFGGVRLEDDVLVTADGCEVFSHVPRSVEDVEAVCAGKIVLRSDITKVH